MNGAVFRLARAQRRLEQVYREAAALGSDGKPRTHLLRKPMLDADWNALWQEIVDEGAHTAVSFALIALLRRSQRPFYPSELEARALRAGRVTPLVRETEREVAREYARLATLIELVHRPAITRQSIRWTYRDAVLPGADRIKEQKRKLIDTGRSVQPESEIQHELDANAPSGEGPRFGELVPSSGERSGGYHVIGNSGPFVPAGGDLSITEAKALASMRRREEITILGPLDFTILTFKRYGLSSRETAAATGIFSANAIDQRRFRASRAIEGRAGLITELVRKNWVDSVRSLVEGGCGGRRHERGAASSNDIAFDRFWRSRASAILVNAREQEVRHATPLRPCRDGRRGDEGVAGHEAAA